jgi:hypothetical protein
VVLPVAVAAKLVPILTRWLAPRRHFCPFEAVIAALLYAPESDVLVRELAVRMARPRISNGRNQQQR